MSLVAGKVVAPGEGKATWFLGHRLEMKVRGADTNGAWAMFEHLTAPAPLLGAPPHVHKAQDEWFYVVSGQIRCGLDREVVEAGPGSTILIPSGTVHWFENAGAEPSLMLCVVSPAGLEEFFEELGEPATTRALPPPPSGPPDIARMMALSDKYGFEILPVKQP